MMSGQYGAQVSFAAQLDSFLTQVRKQREQLLDLSADVQLQVDTAAAPMCCVSHTLNCVAQLWSRNSTFICGLCAAQVTVLLKWLGDSADADPQAIFSSIAQFARAFDRAYALVTRR